MVLEDCLVSHGSPCRLLIVFYCPWHWTTFFHAVYCKRHGTDAKSKCCEKNRHHVTFLPLAVFLQQFEAAPRDSSSKTYSRFFSSLSYNKRNYWDLWRSVLRLVSLCNWRYQCSAMTIREEWRRNNFPLAAFITASRQKMLLNRLLKSEVLFPCNAMQFYNPAKQRFLAVNSLLLSLAVLAAIFQCCGFPSVVIRNDQR